MVFFICQKILLVPSRSSFNILFGPFSAFLKVLQIGTDEGAISRLNGLGLSPLSDRTSSHALTTNLVNSTSNALSCSLTFLLASCLARSASFCTLSAPCLARLASCLARSESSLAPSASSLARSAS